MTPEENQMVEMALSNVAKNYVGVRDSIDSFSSAKLKRVLKAITYVRAAEDILGQSPASLEEDEQKLVDKVFQLQEDIIGYIQLSGELAPKEGTDSSDLPDNNEAIASEGDKKDE